MAHVAMEIDAMEFDEVSPAQVGSVWLVRQRATATSPTFTGVRHSDFDCPAVRRWIEMRPYESNLVEIERDGWGLFEWFASNGGAWGREDADQKQFDLSTWRPCLRCGSVPPAPAVGACGTCWLAPCGCPD